MLGAMQGCPPDAKRERRLTRSPTMEGEQAKLTVAIDPGSDPIAGWLTLPRGAPVPFEGYVELIAALERVRAPTASNPQPADRPPSAPTTS